MTGSNTIEINRLLDALQCRQRDTRTSPDRAVGVWG